MVFVVPARVVVGMIDGCGARGVRGVMVVSSGFAEAGEHGRALQEELRAAAIRNRIPLLGPNVEGFVNYIDHVAPYGTTPPPDRCRGIACCRSGHRRLDDEPAGVGSPRRSADHPRGRQRGGPRSRRPVRVGGGRPPSKVVTSYIETMRDVEGIGRGLDALRAARKPVVLCAPEGRSEAARRSIVAHTGALAGTPRCATPGRRAGRDPREDPVTMFEAAVCSPTRGGSGGVAAACSPAARARSSPRRPARQAAASGVRPGDEARAPARAAAVRVGTTRST